MPSFEEFMERCKNGGPDDGHRDRFDRHFMMMRLGRRGIGGKGLQLHGERNSGTNYFEKLCHANTCGACETGSKHSMAAPRSHHFGGGSTLHVVITRNAVDWLLSMWRYPVHCGHHCDLPTFYAFISTEWGPPPDGSKSWAGPGVTPGCAGFAHYKQTDGTYPRDLLEHRSRWVRSYRAAAGAGGRESAAGNWLWVRHEDLSADGGMGFAPIFQKLFDAGLLVPSARFPEAMHGTTSRSQVDAKAMASHSAYVKLTAGIWPRFTEAQFEHRRGMIQKETFERYGLAPTFDQKVLAHIQTGVDAALEAELGYDYAFPNLKVG